MKKIQELRNLEYMLISDLHKEECKDINREIHPHWHIYLKMARSTRTGSYRDMPGCA